jgi:hypothetical protein
MIPPAKLPSPADPAFESPDRSAIDPDAPLLVVPELNDKAPLTPLVPALVLRMYTEPLDFAVPKPAAMLTAPPVSTVATPALTAIEPANELALEPTFNPIVPDDAVPAVDPVEKIALPDAPAAAA